MKNIKLLVITSIFLNLLTGCGMKGPLYHPSAAKDVKPVTEQGNKALTGLQPTKEILLDNIQDKLQEDASSGPEITEENQQFEQTKAPTTTTKQAGILTNSARLLAIEASHFTLQLSSMNSKESLQQFVIKYNLPREGLYIYKTNSDQPRYIVIYGEYESKQVAEMASKNLPDFLADISPWVKKYQVVHQELSNEK